ncbi:NAD+ kinase [Anaeroplasma bactoclasticum]|jgi:NAD+ kinase|uniref:NAD+ kinase n=1 Tax=Anaeroplasma bactoclasticum TaxID=2088 RepID=A0A397RUG7_9MOLU|nr:NAD kinase [Anaeroplasma bactoclasticum]RIA75775.1 NAD+ kinase [Anaeroplasma bactoclasticum]
MKYCILIKNDDLSKELAAYIRKNIKYSYDENNPDITIAIGGDGTILQAFHKYPSSVVFGLHTGHLGFFANYNPDTIDLLIEDINNHQYKIDEMELLSCKIEEANGNTYYADSINESTILSPKKTLILDVKIDGELLEKYRGTGLCVSTNYGSTGYNKSLHGAVVDHDLTIMQLSEVASINSNAYRSLGSPLILSSKKSITLESENPIEVSASVDNLSYDVKEFKKATFFYQGHMMKMGYHTPEGFIKRIARTFIDSGK